MEQRARYRGALLGLATGDALGAPLAFKQPGTFEPLTDIVGGGPFDLKPGEWTDDTTMALCLAESLVQCHGFDVHDQMQRYVKWMDTGYYSVKGYCFDIAGATSAALHRFKQTNEPYASTTSPQTAGNGSLMRLAPVALYYAYDMIMAIVKAGDSSRTTHAAPVAVDACRYLGALIVSALHGVSKDELLTPRYAPIPDYWQSAPLHPDILAVADGSFKHKQPPDIRGTGYVVNSLEAALWAFYHSTSFAEGALLAVNLGNNADTTGAVYGQLAGAYYGVDNIPQPWLDQLAMHQQISELADKLYVLGQYLVLESRTA